VRVLIIFLAMTRMVLKLKNWALDGRTLTLQEKEATL
jgi:hypothetical protein